MNNTALAAFLGMLSLLLGCNGGKPLPDVYRYDKGAVFLDPGQPGSWNISHTCTYTNSSSSCHAVLSVVNMTCGCARAKIDDNTLAPGEATLIHIGFHARCRRESREEAVVISTGLPDRRPLVLRLAADIYPKLQFTPRPVVASALKGGERRAIRTSLVAYSVPSESPESPPSLACDGSFIEVRTIDSHSTTVAHGVRRTQMDLSIDILCPPANDQPDGRYSGHLIAEHRGCTVNQVVAWRRELPINIAPRSVFLQRRGEKSDVCIVKMTSDVPFTIIKSSADGAGITTTCAFGEVAKSHDLRIELAAQARDGIATSSQVLLLTDHPGQKCIAVPVHVLW